VQQGKWAADVRLGVELGTSLKWKRYQKKQRNNKEKIAQNRDFPPNPDE